VATLTAAMAAGAAAAAGDANLWEHRLPRPHNSLVGAHLSVDLAVAATLGLMPTLLLAVVLLVVLGVVVATPGHRHRPVRVAALGVSAS
jgi:hypothetical protein